ncbi:hypothetical protein MM300_07290 [Evansella sp. LMS18]|uniref:hypothetical protein n=1 Tax=Evansella sp. LMS18 TaxID=2924033 RepID=UPI0020D0DB19|nr:hypothetical protein [Evansella sp. LMS18]UTR12088.1 hypothetical protein MM300_07290 [Evansella sp. LMS18]
MDEFDQRKEMILEMTPKEKALYVEYINIYTEHVANIINDTLQIKYNIPEGDAFKNQLHILRDITKGDMEEAGHLILDIHDSFEMIPYGLKKDDGGQSFVDNYSDIQFLRDVMGMELAHEKSDLPSFLEEIYKDDVLIDSKSEVTEYIENTKKLPQLLIERDYYITLKIIEVIKEHTEKENGKDYDIKNEELELLDLVSGGILVSKAKKLKKIEQIIMDLSNYYDIRLELMSNVTDLRIEIGKALG